MTDEGEPANGFPASKAQSLARCNIGKTLYGTIAGFVVGFQSQSHPSVAYAHFIAVRPEERRSGFGRALYEQFFEDARKLGCTAVEAITAPINARSIAFHTRLGFSVLPGGALVDGVAVSVDHEGPGQHRVRMRREL